MQFIWSLEDPYDQIEVQVIIGATTTVYTYKGNTGMVSQRFDNPATTDPVDITIKARCICNPDAVPVEYGAFTTTTLSVKPNSLPVAVDDYFTVPARYEGPLPYSVLDNDYDPDGDAIEASINEGTFGTSSYFSIDKAGIVTVYNTPATNTQLSFDYSIKNPDGPTASSAKVYINFGDGPQAVYVKWVMRNVVGDPSQSGDVTQTADAWIDFFSDPACTIPLDITAYGITINAQWKELWVENGGYQDSRNYTVVGTGTKMLLYSGTIYQHSLNSITLRWEFTVLSGTGYTPVNP